jgi:ribosomal-protein-alanine N-acetyltransferase
MQSFMRRLRLSTAEIDVRPAQLSDRSTIDNLTENNRHTHFNLDWWTFDDWLPPDRSADAIWIAQHQHLRPIGVVAIPLDASPVAWIRSAAIDDGYEPHSIFNALLDQAVPPLRSRGVTSIVSVAYPDWYADLLGASKFTPVVEVISFRKDDRGLPDSTATADPRVLTRPAHTEDIPAIARNDRAAFDEVWWYSEKSIAHVLPLIAHFIVAEIAGQIVGHAFSDIYGGQGHLIRLAVHPNFQQRGIGEKLLIESLRYQIAAGAYPLTVNTQSNNLPSQKLYRRFGYRSIGVPVKIMQRSIV